MKPLPQNFELLVEELDQFYPDRVPNLKDTEREIWFKAGQRSVVDTLQQRLKYTREDNVHEKPSGVTIRT